MRHPLAGACCNFRTLATAIAAATTATALAFFLSGGFARRFDRFAYARRGFDLGAGLPGLLSPAFYWWHYGTPSLLAREAASLSSVSLSRATELLFDLNIGLAPYMPATVALFVAAAGAALVRVRRSPFDAALVGVLGLAALVSTSTDNWNHATIGPSRYAVWLSPIVVFLVVRFGGTLGPGRLRTFYRSGLSLAIATQAVVMVAKRGPVAQPDYLDHSDLARFVLRHTPSLYSPSVPIFATRTTHEDPAPAGPADARRAARRPGSRSPR